MARRRRRRRKHSKHYHLSKQQFEALFKKQNGLCAICKLYIPEIHQHCPVPLTVDHDHNTGKVRGLLCCRCNAALGGFCDNTNLLRLAITYLECEGVENANNSCKSKDRNTNTAWTRYFKVFGTLWQNLLQVRGQNY